MSRKNSVLILDEKMWCSRNVFEAPCVLPVNGRDRNSCKRILKLKPPYCVWGVGALACHLKKIPMSAQHMPSRGARQTIHGVRACIAVYSRNINVFSAHM